MHMIKREFFYLSYCTCCRLSEHFSASFVMSIYHHALIKIEILNFSFKSKNLECSSLVFSTGCFYFLSFWSDSQHRAEEFKVFIFFKAQQMISIRTFLKIKKLNYLKQMFSFIGNILLFYIGISKFYEKGKSITIMDWQVEDWVIFATQVSAKAKNRAKFKTKKNKEGKKNSILEKCRLLKMVLEMRKRIPKEKEVRRKFS